MNKLNYATLEASKRLIDAGMAIMTDVVRIVFVDGSDKLFPSHFPINSANHPEVDTIYPAPSMAEVWRELPDIHNEYGITMMKYLGDTWCKYYDPHGFASTNPTDALIGLLIWVRNGGV